MNETDIIVDTDIAQNKAIINLDIPTNTTMKNPRNNSQNKNQKIIIKKTKNLNSILQPKKTQDRQIIIDSNSDESESDLSEEISDDKLNEFINKDVWWKLLHLHLKTTDQQILRKNPVITEKLVKSCDEYTIDLVILIKLGVIKLLPVRELLT
ncbi:3900_t:CDS:2, partial [Funneliformis geosporum]